jgi:glycosyltransferase involved in cell wall biosynthesis
MRIAQISTTAETIRENSSGSVESQVWLMARELTRRGHEVTTFGVAGSDVDGEFVRTLSGPYGAENSFDDWHLCEWMSLCEAIKHSGRFDILHSHVNLWGLPLEALANAPMVHTMQTMPEDDTARLWRLYPNARVIALSRQQYSAFPDLNPITVIPPGLDATRFTFQPTPEDYVCYLGRFEIDNGVLQAIAATRAAGIRLVMTGPTSQYFREKIEPMVDGKSIEYAGLVKGADREKLFGNAKAFIYPIQYPEAFSVVLVEAMLCGTPVVALNVGVVPEIVENGVSGFYTNSASDLASAINKSSSLDRARIRQYAEQKFSVARTIAHHEQVYKAVSGAQGFA